MRILVVVRDPKDMPLKFEGAELITSRDYLTDKRYAEMRGARVFNLCRSYRYQSSGYYVSLLASARGHKPVPGIATIQDLKSQAIVRATSEELDDDIQRSLAPIHSKEFVLSIYFGRNLAKRHDNLSRHLFKLFPAPLMRAHFSFREKDKRWYIRSLSPVAASEIPEEHRAFVVEAAGEFFRKRWVSGRRRSSTRFDLAILHDPEEAEPPSDPVALKRFVKAAEGVGLAAELIEKEDYGRLAEFDALFIRETTAVTHHTYRFARKGVAEGLVVVDDPDSILKCTNKVFLAELLERNRVRTPKTVILHKDNVEDAAHGLGFPCVLKRPDSSFSQGVVKAEDPEGLMKTVDELFAYSDLIIAQEFLSTPFDWRVGIFDRKVLYVCRYFMTRRHWQIVRRDSAGATTEYGRVETIPVEEAPEGLLKTALRAANLIGDGLYGVDVKETGGRFHVIEVNDNPTIESGVEDAVLKGELYSGIMRVILSRVEQRKGGGAR